MNNPELLLVPALMLADYFLTIFSVIEAEKKYVHHFKVPHLELNPLFQDTVRRKTWFCPRHLLTTAFLTLGLILLSESLALPTPLWTAVLGFFLVFYGRVVSRNLANYLSFRYIRRHPNEISGEVTVSHSFNLTRSLHSDLTFLLPLILVAAFAPSPFMFGGIAGASANVGVGLRWLYDHHKKQEAAQSEGTDAEGNGRARRQRKLIAAGVLVLLLLLLLVALMARPEPQLIPKESAVSWSDYTAEEAAVPQHRFNLDYLLPGEAVSGE